MVLLITWRLLFNTIAYEVEMHRERERERVSRRKEKSLALMFVFMYEKKMAARTMKVCVIKC